MRNLRLSQKRHPAPTRGADESCPIPKTLRDPKIVIVGGVAGGATAAARARRLHESAEIIMIERGEFVSFANCGLPYHIGGEIAQRESLLVQTVQGLSTRFNLDIRTQQEVTAVDPAAKKVTVRRAGGGEYEESYDALLLSPGASPFIPPIKGVDSPNVFSLRNIPDMDKIKSAVDGGAKSAVVVGGGFIGIEVAENLSLRGLAVSIVELQPQVMPPLDPEVAAPLQQQLAAHGIGLHLNNGVTEISPNGAGLRVHIKEGEPIDADMVVMAVGVKPDTGLAKDAGLKLNERGAIVVDEHLRTSDPNIYAVGDAVEVRDALTGEPAMLPLAGPANRQARIAADNMFGIDSTYGGVIGTSVVRVFNAVAASAGASEKTLKRRGAKFESIYVHRGSHVGYFPGGEQMMIKLLFEPDSGKLLGAQIVGGDGVDKRIDVLATALKAGMTVFDLEELELAYAPQFGAAKDPVNIAGYVASNVIRGDEAVISPNELDPAKAEEYTLVDVREPSEFDAGHIENALLIPLGQLRDRWTEIPTHKPIAVYCAAGQRAYYATRILRANGLSPKNLTGGYKTWATIHRPAPLPTKPHPTTSQTTNSQGATSMTGGAGASAASSSCCSSTKTADVADVAQMTDAAQLDVRGLQCPGPLAKLSAFARAASIGQTVEVISSDIGFASDVEAWCKRSGHTLLERRKSGKDIIAEIAIGGEPQLPLANKTNGHALAAAPALDAMQAAINEMKQNKTIVVFSGDLDRVMASFVIANAAADMGDRVTLFFTFWGLAALRKDNAPAVQKDMLSKMFGWMIPRGAKKLKLSQMHMAGMGTSMMKGVMRSKQVDDLPTLIANAQSKGVRMVACSMSMDVMGLKPEELLDGVEISGAAGYLSAASDGNVNLFI